ncbi:hypothetical protein D2C83_00570 [Helicobacter pylori]|nr:hypothetical protein [Helicobacter pylori]NHA20573.1 hypothetical protein [Helicobacter pylori]QEF26267.1 hypothetical protein D2C83_00570 [Helicobacter pylori]
MKTYPYTHFLFFCFILGAFLLGLLSPAYALSIITTKEIDANLPNGAIEGRVVLGKRVFKVEAHGFYFRNNAAKSIDIEITSLLKPHKQKSQISLVFGMNALVPLGTI